MKSTPRNLAKQMARLNPKSQSLMGSRGGMPDITPEDVAGALGIAASKGPGPHLAVLVVALRWWPGLVEGPRKTVGHTKITHREKGRNAQGKRITWTWEEQIPIEAPTETPAFKLVASILAAKLRSRVYRHYLPESSPRTRGDVKLRLPDPLFARIVHDEWFTQDWARVVIAEYRHPNHCPTCTPWGRAGQVPLPIEREGKIVEVRWDTCPKCAGAGSLGWGRDRRAKAIGMRGIEFASHLAIHHEGALALLRELEWRGVRRIKRRL